MNTIFSLILLLAFHSFIPLIRAQPQKYPLLFNPYIRQGYNNLDEKLKANSDPMKYPLLAACPAQSKKEIEINESQSKDHKALFVRKYYATEVKFQDIIRCESDFEMAAVHIPGNKYAFVGFGYEVYLDKSIIPKEAEWFETTPYSQYEMISSGNESEKVPIPSLGNDEPLKFIWLTRIALQYDAVSWNVREIKYTIHRKAEKLHVQCDDNNLGKQFYKEDDLDKYYLRDNTNHIFEAIELPKKTDCQFSEKGCLEKYNLLMPYHFQSNPTSIVSCSDLTTIPIWHEVSRNLLDYSEKFLTAISENTRNMLMVISGTYGTLSLLQKNQPSEEIEWKKIYLAGSESEKIPVPQIIYKIVRYQSYDCDDILDLCWFDIVIVIHNEPEITQKKLCEEDACEELGWNSIQYMSTSTEGKKSEHIYCCKMDQKMQEQLYYDANYRKDDLNLKSFPVYNKETNVNDRINMLEDFLKPMDILSTPKL